VRKQPLLTYRSFKDFNIKHFNTDLQNAALEATVKHTDDNTTYNHFSNTLTEIINKHAPIKQRKAILDQAPFMNKKLRQEIYHKKMLHNKFVSTRTKHNWGKYRTQRNKVTTLRKQSIIHYFIDRFTGAKTTKTFGKQ